MNCKECNHPLSDDIHYRLRNGKLRCALCLDWGKESHG